MNAHTNSHVHTTTHPCIFTYTSHIHAHTRPCACRMDTVLFILQARRLMTGLWRCSFRLGLRQTCRIRWKIVPVLCQVQYIHFGLSTTQHSGEYECQKHLQLITTSDMHGINKSIVHLCIHILVWGHVFPRNWTENASLGSKLQCIFQLLDMHLVQKWSLQCLASSQ